jgi:hypothetical protein
MNKASKPSFMADDAPLSDQLAGALRCLRARGKVRFRQSPSMLRATFVGEPSPLDAGRLVALVENIEDGSMVRASIDALYYGCLKIELGFPALSREAREGLIQHLKSAQFASFCGRTAIKHVKYNDGGLELSFPVHFEPERGEAAARAQNDKRHVKPPRGSPQTTAA